MTGPDRGAGPDRGTGSGGLTGRETEQAAAERAAEWSAFGRPEGGAPRPVLSRRDRIRNRIVAVAGLVLVWTMLWGEFTWPNLITGLVVATVVLSVFPLPPVTFAGRIRPLGVLRFWLRFLGDLVVASVQLAVLAFRFGHVPRSAVVAVTLRVHSDLNLTLVSEAVSLVPGSLIVEADRATGTLYVHIFGVATRSDVDKVRAHVLAVESRLIRALGSRTELGRLDTPPPPVPTPAHPPSTDPPSTDPRGESS